MSKKKPELSRKRILSDAKLITTGPVSKIVNGQWGADMSKSDKEWYMGYFTAWQDIQFDIERGIYDKRSK